MSQDGETPEPESERARLRREREHLRRLRINEAGVALAALLVSVTVIGVNAYNHRRGSQMVVLQPETVIFYRTGSETPVLRLALPIAMVNASRDYGDVVVEAGLGLELEGLEQVSFAYEKVVEPVMTSDVARALDNCPESARCVGQTGHYVIERSRALLDVPGGTSRTLTLAFPLESSNCRGPETACARLRDYADVMSTLRSGDRLRLQLTLRYQFDGEKNLYCTLPETASPTRAGRGAILDYLNVKGWASAACMETL